MTSKAQVIVNEMLTEAYDEHVKAHERVQKWDKAHSSYQALLRNKQQAAKLFGQLGHTVSYERALARVGVEREEVSGPIFGAMIGHVDNCKAKHPIQRCQTPNCKQSPKPETQETCTECGQPLTTDMVPYSFTELHGRYAQHILGVELNDGRRVWFDEPVPPARSLEA